MPFPLRGPIPQFPAQPGSKATPQAGYQFVQDAACPTNNSASTVTASTINVTAGNLLVVAVAQSSDPARTVTGNGNTFIYAGDTLGGLGAYYCLNANGGATTVSAGGVGTQSGVYVAEYSGLSAFVGSTLTAVAGPGSGTDKAKSAPLYVQSTGLPALVWGFMWDQPGGSDGGNSAGTGYFGRNKCWPGSTSTQFRGYPEDKRLIVNGNVQATWTIDNANQFDTVCIALLVFAENPIVPTQWIPPQAPGRLGPTYTFSSPSLQGVLITGNVAVSLTGQTATFTEGTITPEDDYFPGAQTATSSEGTIGPEADYNPTGQTTGSSLGNIAPGMSTGINSFLLASTEGIILATGGDVVTSQAGGTGSSRKRKLRYSKDVFLEEMAKLTRQAEVATQQREEIEEKLKEPVSDDMLRYIADFERALKRAQAIERRQAEAVQVPVYFRLPAKSEGVKRVEAHQRLQTLAKIARYREEVAKERLRKVKERIDEEAAIAFMQFIMWDD